jgi:cell division protein FtsB
MVKKEDHRSKFLIWGGLLILIVLGVLGVFGKKGLLQLEGMRHKKVALQGEVKQLEGENKALKDKIRALRSDKREIEKLARDELGLVKPGEVIYQFIYEKEGE